MYTIIILGKLDNWQKLFVGLNSTEANEELILQ